jgi:tRNA(Ile)-lysidine synthase
MLRQVLSLRPDAKMHVVFGNAEIRCFRGEVYVSKARTGRTTADQAGPADIVEGWPQWHGEKELAVDELGGIIRFAHGEGIGINLNKLTRSPVTIRFRQGGERLRPDCNRPRRSLKNLLREASLPPWEREALPLIYSGEHLACVPGIGIECDFQAAPGEQGLVVSWERGN